jgi:hypothetical protein
MGGARPAGRKRVERRQCVSCRFFRFAASVSVGTCDHPDRQTTGIRPIVRAGELRCRRSFTEDDWAPARLFARAPQDDILISERPAPLRPVIPVVHPNEPEPDHSMESLN